MERSITAEDRRQIDRIRRRTESDALVSAWTAGVAEHRETRRGGAGGDHVLRVTLCPGRVDLDVVTRTGRDVLDLQRSHHRTPPLGFAVARDFRHNVLI